MGFDWFPIDVIACQRKLIDFQLLLIGFHLNLIHFQWIPIGSNKVSNECNGLSIYFNGFQNYVVDVTRFSKDLMDFW